MDLEVLFHLSCSEPNIKKFARTAVLTLGNINLRASLEMNSFVNAGQVSRTHVFFVTSHFYSIVCA